jgi:two-component system chemotaxis response regulator CheB
VVNKTDIPRFELGRFKAVAIASSTGGPGIVEKILSGLPADIPFPIFIAQHLPPTFTESFASRLDVASAITVIHAEHDMPVFPGTAYVGRGHQHMRVLQTAYKQKFKIEISDDPKDLLFKPSCDELLKSCAKIYRADVLAIVLTGIGRDGVLGARDIHQAGGVVLTQSAHTCAVYGMPKSCVEAGFSDAQLDPQDISRALLQLSPQHHEKAYVR